jgi:RNA polymerase sigma-70 factor (ECF subfamily)
MDSSPRRLVDGALQDPEAFGEIIDQHKAMIYSVAYNFFGNRSVAEDVAQDVYLELYKNLERIESDLHLTFWLRQAVTRKCIDYTRRLKHRRYQPLDEIVEPSAKDVSWDPMLAEALGKKVRALPKNMRMVVILRFQEDLKLSEIADALDMPLNTVKTTLRRALARLRDRVEELQGEMVYGAGRI